MKTTRKQDTVSCDQTKTIKKECKQKTPVLLFVTFFTVMSVISSTANATTYYYDKEDAVDYALDWCDGRNPSYVNFGDYDCTNFVSQCMQAGGWPETGKYLDTNLSAWYYDGSSTPWYSHTWSKAENFSHFLTVYSNRGYAYSLGHTPWNQYFEPGDLVQIDYQRDGIWDHSMIITDIDQYDIYVSYHSDNECDIALSDVMDVYPNAWFMGYILYDQFNE